MNTLRRYMLILAVIGFMPGASWLPVEAQAPTVSQTDGEVLQRNWDSIRARGLRLLPVPKQIRFEGEPVALSGEGRREVVIVLAGDSEAGRIALDSDSGEAKDGARCLISILGERGYHGYRGLLRR